MKNDGGLTDGSSIRAPSRVPTGPAVGGRTPWRGDGHRVGIEESLTEIKTETVMSKAQMDALQVRLDVLSLALAEIARALPPDRAASVRKAIRNRVTQRLDGVALSDTADAVVAGDLGGLIGALEAGLA